MTDASNDYLKAVAPQSNEDFLKELDAIESTPYDPEEDAPPIQLEEVEVMGDRNAAPVAEGEVDPAFEVPGEAPAVTPEREVSGVGGYAADIGYGAVNGVINAGTEINHTLANIADFLGNKTPWKDDPEYFTKLAEEYSPRLDGSDLESVGLKAPASTVGNITKGIAQFMTGFLPALKAVRVIKGIGSTGKLAMTAKTALGAGTAGAVADLSVFNPYEERLSNMAKDSGITGFDNAVTQYLAADVDDPELLARVKQTAEGFVVGKVLEPFIALIGATKKSKMVYAEESGAVPRSQATASYMTDPATGAKVDVTEQLGEEAPRFTLKEAAITVPDDATQQAFAIDYLDGNFEGAASKASGMVNLKYLNTEEGIRDMIEGFAQVKNQAIGKHRRGWEEAAKAAGKLGNDALPEAAARVEGLDSFVIKAEETRTAVAYKVKELANINKASPSAVTSEEFKDAFKKLLVIDAMVTGNKTEIARAMKAMQRPTTGADMVNSITATAKGAVGANGQTNWDKLAEMVGQLPDSVSITRMAKASTLPNWKDAAVEVYINALFSPPTYVVNALSNTLSMASGVGERYLGAARSQLVGSGDLSFKEANNYALGLVKGVSEGVLAFSQSWKTNAPVMGVDNKFLETNQLQGFSKEAFGLGEEVSPKWQKIGATLGIKDGDSPVYDKLGKGLDLIGVGLRSLPGGTRSLMATDEFFKAIFYRGEISALAQREAQKLGLKAGTPEYLAKIREIEVGASTAKVGEPYYGISMSSQDAAARGTFTENLGEGGSKLMEGLREFKMSYAILPFIKTPTNLIKYMTRRTPGLAGQSDYMLGEIAAGGARADLAEAQISAGAMYLTAGLALAGGGYLRGAVTDNFAARRNMNQLEVEQQAYIDPETGEQTALGRLDGNPISFLLFAATVHETVQAYIDANADELTPEEVEHGVMEILAIPAGVAAKYVLNKTWTQGMSQALEAIQKDTEGNYIQKMLGNTLPAGNTIKWVNKQTEDPYLREASSALEEIMNKIPGLSRTLPPVPDLLGNPSKTKQLDGFGTNPITQKIPTDHPVMNELRRLQLKDPNKVILGGVTRIIDEVKLDGVEKWNFMQFVRQIKDDDGKDLVDTLQEVITSDDYNSPTMTDARRNEYLSNIYNKRKDLAKKALQYDSLMFSKGLPRPYAEEYDLYDYKRITPLASKVGTKEYTKKNALFGDVGMAREDFIDKRNDELVKSNLGLELQ
ncbi:MAG: hypothetical protein B7X95_09255 [Methylophilaceae bacterium 17-44-8]|nr:MAG: hypothetical protein B7X95_09255 [Methylophilaceae bacterium 17-44-8]